MNTIILQSKQNHCELSEDAIAWLNGELLGDGCLRSRSRHSANFRHGSKHLEYIHYIVNTLSGFGLKGACKVYRSTTLVYHFETRAYVELRPLWKEWYPNGKKVVPRSVKLLPMTCRQWHIGDGSLKHRLVSKDIQLATCCFSVEDVKWLIAQLEEIGILATRQFKSNYIRIAACSVKDFLNYIGKCPVECYKYKWNV